MKVVLKQVFSSKDDTLVLIQEIDGNVSTRDIDASTAVLRDTDYSKNTDRILSQLLHNRRLVLTELSIKVTGSNE